MIMKIEATFCKMHEQFQAILTKLERATEENRPIHEVEQELVEDLRILVAVHGERTANGREWTRIC